MAALSAIRNKKNQKLREAIEDTTAKCGDKAGGDGVKVRRTLLEIICNNSDLNFYSTRWSSW